MRFGFSFIVDLSPGRRRLRYCSRRDRPAVLTTAVVVTTIIKRPALKFY